MKQFHQDANKLITTDIEKSVKVVTLKDHITFGNKKLPKNIAIFNMGSAKTCPSEALGLCPIGLKNCYAYKAEVQYKNAVPQYRTRQEHIWKNTSAEEFAQVLIDIKAKKRTLFNQLRFNEAGDCWSQECVDKVQQIAQILKSHGITTYLYTARCDLDFTNISTKELGLNSSNQPLPMKDGQSNCFTAVNEFSGDNLSCVGDCRKCSLCSVTTQKTIEVLYH